MSRFFIVLSLALAACSSTTNPAITGSTASPATTTTTTLTATTTEAPAATTTTATSTIPTTTIARDPDTATQNQLRKVLAAAESFYEAEGRYPTIDELVALGQLASTTLGEPGLPFVIGTNTTLLVVGSSESGKGFCVLAEDAVVFYGMGTIPEGVDTVRECRGVGSPNPWN
ncbi:MAG: hypothetical protein OEM22_00655 [Acidimicrobiia bacterium]|nr:hypothetical protein [Acidimicrobiia bacterium]MDH3470057.1 hypothetical protein [Acidimicrobiia bacterium]